MKICIKETQEYEIEIFQKYIAKFKTVWGCNITCMYLTALAFTIGSVFISTSLSCDAEYPFQLNYTLVFFYKRTSIKFLFERELFIEDNTLQSI